MTMTYSIKKERGEKADIAVAEKIISVLSRSWEPSASLPKHQILLLLAGFQGSGKTSVLQDIQKSHRFITISTDEIRHHLFEVIEFSEVFEHNVCFVRNQLLVQAFRTGHHITIDENNSPWRIEFFRSLLEEHHTDTPKIVSVYLSASEETLIKRIRSRPQLPGRHAGTVDELQASLKKYGHPDLAIYDAVLDSENSSIDELVAQISRLLEAAIE